MDNIKIYLTETRYEYHWIHLVQEMDQWQALVNMIMKFWVP